MVAAVCQVVHNLKEAYLVFSEKLLRAALMSPPASSVWFDEPAMACDATRR